MAKDIKEVVWPIYRGMTTEGRAVEPHEGIETLPDPPGWRSFGRLVGNGRQKEEVNERPVPAPKDVELERGRKFRVGNEQVQMVNAALFLRRPLLVTGRPGTGKSTLAYSVARELMLGPVLVWPITTHTSFQEGLYTYDAIGRLQAAAFNKETEARENGAKGQERETTELEQYIRLGPLGTALLPSRRPRVLLIDEIDKSDIDLPNNLLTIFEEGEFRIEELARLARLDNAPGKRKFKVRPFDSDEAVEIEEGVVQCSRFPFVVMTSNGEREFPPAFLRRCLRLEMPMPGEKELAEIVKIHFGDKGLAEAGELLKQFDTARKSGYLATDQLLNAIYLTMHKVDLSQTLAEKTKLADVIWRALDSRES